MELLNHLLPDSDNFQLQNWSLDRQSHHITLKVASIQSNIQCPKCREPSHKTHSHYERTLADLPWFDYRVSWQLLVRKFFCSNRDCQRRIFTERIPAVAVPWGRRTQRLAEQLAEIGLALGGAAGARLSKRVSQQASCNTLLRLISRLGLPKIVVPKTLGVDDFAFRKRQSYGTILVDLDQSRPIALLKDREAKTLAQWLKQHPGVEVLSRDRSVSYKSGMTQGAPDATQVADRFHLLQNITQVLGQVLETQGKVLKLAQPPECCKSAIHPKAVKVVPATQAPECCKSAINPKAIVPAPSHSSPKNQQKTQRRTQRLETCQTICQLHEQGWSTTKIAQLFGVSCRTVQRYLLTSSFPEWQPRSDRGKSKLTPYKDYIVEQWNSGHRQARSLFKDLQQQGYTGSYMTLTRYIRYLQPQLEVDEALDAQSLPSDAQNLSQANSSVRRTLTARQASYLAVQNPENRSSDEQQLLSRLIEPHPQIIPIIDLAQGFAQLVRQRQPEQLDLWLEQAQRSGLEPFERFAKNLQDDYDAVKAGVTLSVSNGPVEGHINRLKMLKRQMYGRAGIDLLSRRFLLAS